MPFRDSITGSAEGGFVETVSPLRTRLQTTACGRWNTFWSIGHCGSCEAPATPVFLWLFCLHCLFFFSFYNLDFTRRSPAKGSLFVFSKSAAVSSSPFAVATLFVPEWHIVTLGAAASPASVENDLFASSLQVRYCPLHAWLQLYNCSIAKFPREGFQSGCPQLLNAAWCTQQSILSAIAWRCS